MSETNTTRLPRHVAIIMDGNGRWAKAHKLAVAQGHRQGTEALRAIIRESSDIGIEALTIYAFSTENWRRSRAEVSALMSLLLEYFTSEIDELDEKNVCIRILGDKDGLPAPQRDALIAAETRTARNTGLKLNIAINYGGRAEIVRAARQWELPVFSNPCPSAGKTKRADMMDVLDAMCAGSRVRRKNIYNGLARWQWEQNRQDGSPIDGNAGGGIK